MRSKLWMARLAIVGAIGLLCCASAAQADTVTANMSVTITINNTCTVSADTVDFGTPTDPSTMLTTPVTATSHVYVQCTPSTGYTVLLGPGSHSATTDARDMASGSDLIEYNLYKDTACTGEIWGDGTNGTATGVGGTGDGTQQSLPVYGCVPTVTTIPPSGTYTDTVLVTVSY